MFKVSHGDGEAATQEPSALNLELLWRLTAIHNRKLIKICLSDSITRCAAHMWQGGTMGGVHCGRVCPSLTVALLLSRIALLVGVLLLGVCLLLGCALLVPSLLLTVLGISCRKKGHNSFLASAGCLQLPAGGIGGYGSPRPNIYLQFIFFFTVVQTLCNIFSLFLVATGFKLRACVCWAGTQSLELPPAPFCLSFRQILNFAWGWPQTMFLPPRPTA
jgi:hypothetical protein